MRKRSKVFMLLAMLFLVAGPLLSAQAMRVDKCTVKAGKGKTGEPLRGEAGFVPRDSIGLYGLLDATVGDFVNADEIVVTIHSALMPVPLECVFPIDDSSFKKGKYSSPRIKVGKNDPKLSLKFDTGKGKFTFMAKNVNLTGLSCPIWVQVEIGNYVAEVQLEEPIVNGKKPVPIQFMMGIENTLRVDKAKVKKGKKFVTDSISVKGAFTVADTYDKNSPVVITVGSDTFTVPGQLFVLKRAVESCKKTSSDEGPIVSAKFDSAKCTFIISIKYASLSDTGDVDFSIDLFDNYLLAPDQIPVPADPRRAEPPTADLILVSSGAPNKIYGDKRVYVSDTVKNNGEAIGVSTYIKYYLSKDSKRNDEDTFLGGRTIPPLAAGASSTGSTRLNTFGMINPFDFNIPYKIIVVVDANNNVYEGSKGEANNMKVYSTKFMTDN